MPHPVPASLLSPEHIAMMDKGVSVIVSSRDSAHRPSLMRAVGSALQPLDGGGWRITVFLARPSSRQLLQDLAATGQIAVVFSEPISHRTVQVKAAQVEIRQAVAADATALQRYLHSMEHEVGLVGFGPAFVKVMLAHRLEDLVAISFVPSQAFDQAPGPRAGAALGMASGPAA